MQEPQVKIPKKELKKLEGLHAERLSKCVPVAKKIVKLIAETDFILGDVKNKEGHEKKESKEYYDDISLKVLQLMFDEDVNFSDRQFIFQLVLQPFDIVKSRVVESLNNSFEVAQGKMFGKDYLDVTLGDLDKILKEPKEE